jgi:uncharacterized protein
MALLINLRHLEKKSVDLKGEISPEELELAELDDMVRLESPASYELSITKHEHNLLVEGSLRQPITCQCVRCLKPFQDEISFENWIAHVALEGEESAPIANDHVDLTPYLREDILLGFPQHPLCSEDCKGLPARKSAPMKESKGPSAWDELNKLKFD